MKRAPTTRPIMPEPVKRAALYRNMRKNGGKLICEETKDELTEDDILSRRIHIDHSPPLELRARDEFGHHKPAPNDLNHLEVVSAVGHIRRTSKRRGLYRGDQTEIAHSRKLRAGMDDHRARMDAKAGIAEIPKQRHKPKLRSRPVPGSKASGWKKPLRGPAVRRHT
jgi:hypothetical protein